MVEIEAQIIGLHQRALLLQLRAKRGAERPVQQMGRRVAASDRIAPVLVDAQRRLLALQKGAALQPNAVADDPLQGLVGIDHAGRAGLALDRARVSDLPAAFSIEGSPLRKHFKRRMLEVIALALEHAQNLALCLQLLVAEELCRPEPGKFRHKTACRLALQLVAGSAPGGAARKLALVGHRMLAALP